MSKMFFTFKWGKSAFITIDDLKKVLLKYYTKEEVNEILRQYATNEAVAGELALKLDISEFEEFKSNLQVELDEKAEQVWVEQEVERLDGEITETKNNVRQEVQRLDGEITEIKNGMQQASEVVGGLIGNLDTRVTKNTEDIATNTSKITSNKQLLDELIEQFKTAKIVVIQGPYSASKTYRMGDVVVSERADDKNLYLSLADNNTGNPLTDTTKWKNLGEAKEVNLDDYYNKTQVDGLLANKANTSDLSNCAKLNANNTYNDGVRNIFRTLPEVYTERTVPTKNTEFTTKKYVDDKVSGDITPTSVTVGSGTSGADGVKVTPSRIDINGSTDIYFNSPNQTSQIYGTVVIDSGDIWRYSTPSNDYSVTNKKYVDNKAQEIKNSCLGRGYFEMPLSDGNWYTAYDTHDNMSARFITYENWNLNFDKPYPITYYTTGDLCNPQGAAWYRRVFINVYWRKKSNGYYAIGVQIQKIYDKNDDTSYYKNNLNIIIWNK